ncbi:hypothetical protein LUZ60_003758 [Juncus effusus]|nr:hypothetical protein LUZ60_003758 [Juncus effusus]
MADDDNALASSTRKRVAGREISKDKPDPDEDSRESELGSFQRASDEVMATRRIVRVKRSQSGSGFGSVRNDNSSFNPFCGIKLVSSSEKSVDKSDKTLRGVGGVRKEEGGEERASGLVQGGEERENAGGERKEAEEEKKGEGEAGEERENVGGERKEAEEEKKTEEGEATEERENVGGERKEAEAQKEAAEGEASEERKNVVGEKKEDAEGQSTEERVSLRGERKEPSLFGSFHQLSSSQNAFSGFLTSNSFTFSTNTSTSSASLFGSVPTNNTANFQTSNKLTMQENQLKTGEENEKTVFTSDAILYEYLTNTWKERGKGEIKLNLTTSGELKPRLVMRSKGNYRLILNASVYADMAVKEIDKRGVTFVCANSVGEGQNGLSTFALKFRDGAVRDEFGRAVEMYRGKNED